MYSLYSEYYLGLLPVMMLIFLCLKRVGETRKYNYVVQIINLTWNSLFSDLNWHHVNGKVMPDVLKMKLIETFVDQVPDTSSVDFSVGYSEKPGNAKCWMESSDDLEAMYTVYPHDNTITLWCDGKDANANTCGTAKLQTISA